VQDPFPVLLSDTGLFVSTSTLELVEGVVRYQPAATMWRDGASSDRLVAIPSNEPIKPNRNRRQFSYPAGTVFANTISRKVLDEDDVETIRRLETQVLVFDGFNWHPYTYRWNDEQTNATLVPRFGDEMPIRFSDPIHQTRDSIHRFQARDQCKTCHHAFHPGAMSFTPTNLTGKSGSTEWSQLALAGWVVDEPGTKKFQVDPYDESESLDRRARSYLDMNCATCHAPAGAGLSKLNVLSETELESTAALGEAPLQGSFGLDSPSVVVVGHPERSVMMYRIATSGAGRMPHIGSDIPDPRGAKLIWDWIASMSDDLTPPTAGAPGPASGTSATLELWYRLQTQDVEVAKATVADYVTKSRSPFDAGLLDAWISPSERKQTIGNRPDVAEIIKLTGDANRGASWYADVSGAQCRACHQKNGVGVAIGPSLDGLKKVRSKGEIIRSLLFPSETVEEKYRASTLLLSNGTVVTGIVVKQDDDLTTVRKTDGTIVELENESIEQSQVNSQSIMPDGQLASLTAQQVADLVAYLLR
jgi:putative heme-binding domain-containing protein